MENERADKAERADCCAEGVCCSPSSAQGLGAARGRKTAVFALIVLLAAGVAAHSLLTRRDGGPEKLAETASEESLPSFKRISAALAEHDVLFVILPGLDDDSAKEIAQPVAAAAAKIQAKGVRVGTLTLGRDEPEFAAASDGLGIERFPAVVALKKGCGQAVVQGEITEGALLRAYLQACAPGPSCGSGPCCP